METKICMSFYLRYAAFRLHRKALNSINNPSFVEFLVSSDKKKFAVRVSEKRSLRSFPVRVVTDSKADRVEFYSLPLCNAFTQLNNWNKNSSYRIFGKAYPEQAVIVFDFSTSQRIDGE